MKLTIHVLFVWPPDSAPDDPNRKPEHEYVFIEHGNEDDAWMAAQEMSGRHHLTDQRTDLITVPVESTRENPDKAALTQARHQVGIRDLAHREVLRVGAGRKATLARTVPVAEAAELLRARYGLTANPDDTGLHILLLRIARRAQLGDAESEIALRVIAEEYRRARANPDQVPPEIDPLTVANRAEGGRR